MAGGEPDQRFVGGGQHGANRLHGFGAHHGHGGSRHMGSADLRGVRRKQDGVWLCVGTRRGLCDGDGGRCMWHVRFDG